MTAIHQAQATPALLRETSGGVATLTLNRPDRYNALSADLLSGLLSALGDIAKDESVRVVVLAGAGKTFCAGHDLKEIHDRADPAFTKEIFEQARRVMAAVTQLPQPVIARVHGVAFAAGCQLVAQCDLAVASSDAKFATSGVNYGVFCSTPGVPLARNVSRKRAMEMLLTGEPIDAATALAHGLVNRVAPSDRLDAELQSLIQAILSKSPAVIAAGKKTFYQQADEGLAQAYLVATEAMVENLRTEDGKEGVAAFVEKRKPHWKNR